MNRLRILTMAWLIAGLIGIPVFGLNLLHMMALGHRTVPIAVLRLPELQKASPDYRPTLEEYRNACSTVKAQLDEMNGIGLAHIFFFGPLVVLCFISYGILKSELRQKKIQK